MHLLQFSQSIDSPSWNLCCFSVGTPCCGPHCLPHRRVTVTQECWARCRVIPFDAPPLSRATFIAAIAQSAYAPLKYHTPNLSRPLSCLQFINFFYFLFFYSINNCKYKSPEQMLRRRKKIGEELGTMKTGENQKEGGGNTSGEQNNPAGPPLPLEASEVTLCFCEGACEQNALWRWVTALYCGITTATTEPPQKCARWL